jgi:nucleotide-binding universal stress UspA family protein
MSDNTEGSAAERKLLVGVGEGDQYLHGVHFLRNFFKRTGNTRLVLCYLSRRQIHLRQVSDKYMVPDEPDKYIAEELHEEKARKALEQSRDMLVQAGYPRENIFFEQIERRRELAGQLSALAESGGHDAVVLGHRGRTWVENLIEGHIDSASDLIGEFLPQPVWICSKPDPERKGVLVCLDGSDSSYRIACHVAHMLRGEDQRITLLRIKRDEPEGPADSEFLFTSTRKICDWSENSEERIENKVIESNDVTGAIVQEAEAGGYAVVAMGRYGAGGGKGKRVFRGAVSGPLFKKIAGASLWTCS